MAGDWDTGKIASSTAKETLRFMAARFATQEDGGNKRWSWRWASATWLNNKFFLQPRIQVNSRITIWVDAKESECLKSRDASDGRLSRNLFLRRGDRHQVLIKLVEKFNSGTSLVWSWNTRWHYESRFYGATEHPGPLRNGSFTDGGKAHGV